jgi:5-methylthioadenosine/S-adenosylhomocysteine deaminase
VHGRILIRGGCAVTMDAERRVIDDAAILVEGRRIAWVGARADLGESSVDAQVIDASGCVITPGLVDAHNHPIHFLSKGIADDLELSERSYRHVWPFEAALTDEEAYVSALGTFAEMLCHGTTCFSDPGSLFPDAVARAAADIGIRGVVSREAWDVPDPNAPPGLTETIDEVLAQGEATVLRLNGSAGGRIRAGLSLVRPGSVTDELCRRTTALADALAVGIHGHMVVSRTTDAQTRQVVGTGSAIPRYERLGVLGPNLCLAHLGALSDDEIDLLRDAGVVGVHCPSASMLGGFGAISHGTVPEMVGRGMAVALGSDAGAISRFVDLVRVAYLAACAHKDARIDPTVMGAATAFEMATLAGARAVRWEDDIGSLEPGKEADLVMFGTDGPEWHPNPLRNPVANLVYSASGSSARTVLVAGEVVLDGGAPTRLDLPAFLPRAAAAADAVLGRIGVTVGRRA